jgi:CubicO group peptidase (beta-lactamase class C family)
MNKDPLTHVKATPVMSVGNKLGARLNLILVLTIAAISFAGCDRFDSEVSGPHELPVADAAHAGFSAERLSHLTEYLEQALQDKETPGAVALILRDGQVVYEQALGHRTPAREQAMTTDTIFRIYSMTKPITSVAVMMLWEEGAFNLNDPIAMYLPEFRDTQVAIKDETQSNIIDTVTPSRPITIQDLLRHTSGMTYGIFGAMTAVKQQYLDAELTMDTFDGDLQQWVETIAQIPLEAHPGERWEYSASPTVLGRLVEVVSGQKFGEFWTCGIPISTCQLPSTTGWPKASASIFAVILRNYMLSQHRPSYNRAIADWFRQHVITRDFRRCFSTAGN